jgi:stage II sporulation protein D
VVKALVVGTRGTTEVTGPQLRTRLGLFDSWIYFTSVSTNVGSPPPATPTPTNPTTPAPSAPITGTGGGLAPTAGAAAVTRGTLTGRIDPARPGAWIKLQRRAPTGWEYVIDVQVGEGGRYAARVREPGTYRVLTGTVAGPSVVVR